MKNIEKKLSVLNGSLIKYIAIACMLSDHIAYCFVPPDTILHQIMRFFGRITAPIMCYFLTEGFHHTHDLKKYFMRMIAFAFISQIPFSFCFAGNPFAVFKSGFSVITTLTVTLGALTVYHNEKIKREYKLPIILLLGLAASYSDWGINLMLFTFCFELARGDLKKQCIAYSAAALYYVFPTIYSYVTMCIQNGEIGFFKSFYKLGIFMPILLISAYNGKRGGGKNGKWIFYIFYPAHLLVIALIRFRCT